MKLVNSGTLPDSFAKFFDNKVKDIVSSTVLNNSVYKNDIKVQYLYDKLSKSPSQDAVANTGKLSLLPYLFSVSLPLVAI